MMTKMIPTSVVKATLTAAVMNRSVSVRAFCSFPSVSPLRWSSKTEYGSCSEWRMPSA